MISSLLGLVLGGILALAISSDVRPGAPQRDRQVLGRQSTAPRLGAPPAARAVSGRDLDLQRAEAQSRWGFNPYRARLFSADLVESLSTDQLIEALRAGQIHTNDELELAFTRVANLDPRLALELLELLPRANEFNTARAAVMSAWTATDPRGVLDYLSRLPTRELRSQLATQLAHQWAEADPAAAMARLAELEALVAIHAKESLAGSLLAKWAETDPDAAERWIENRSAPERRDSLRDSLLVGRMQQLQSADRIDFILGHRDAPVLRRELSNCFQSWAMFEPAAAIGRLAAMPADHAIWLEVGAMGSAVMQNLNMNKRNITQLLTLQDKIPPGEAQRQFLLGAANTASSNDLDAAREVIAQIPESREREQAVGMFTELAMRKDPVALSEWLGSLDASPSRDVAVSRFVSLHLQSDPDRARAWADTISDEAGRRSLLERLPETE